MRMLALLTLALASCGGRTTDDESGSSSDAAVDSGADAAIDTRVDSSSTCFGAAVPIVPYKVCSNDSDCMVASHQLDCCGNARLVGIAKSQASAFGACETAWDKTFPGCGCPASAPTAEDGKTVPFGETPHVRCSKDYLDAPAECVTYVP